MSESTDTIVLIHGLWMTPRSWEHWIDRYTSRGHTVLAPAWPRMQGEVEEIRRDPSPLAGLGIREIADHYDRIVRGLDRPPIIMGHSFGGLFVQLLLDRGLGAAGVGVDSAQPKGILPLPLSTIRAASPVLGNPLNYGKTTGLTEKQFRYAFGNTLSAEESRATWERYAIPAANSVLFQGALANFNPNSPAKVNFRNDERAPLLLIAGGKDHIVPPKITRLNVKKYAKSKAVTEYKEFSDRAHSTVGAPGWEEVADYALDWAIKHVASDAPVVEVAGA
jgi:pimeloyl-ACP methyl ester carboxylesterase